MYEYEPAEPLSLETRPDTIQTTMWELSSPHLVSFKAKDKESLKSKNDYFVGTCCQDIRLEDYSTASVRQLTPVLKGIFLNQKVQKDVIQ